MSGSPTPGTWYKGDQVLTVKYADEAVWLAFNGWRKTFDGVSIDGNRASHGDVEGPIVVDAEIDYHEFNVTGDVEIAVRGQGEVALRFTGEGAISFTDDEIVWETEPVGAPGTVILARYYSGWRAYGLGTAPPLPAITPTAPTFADGSNTITIPTVAGWVYTVDGVTIAAGAHPGYPLGDVLVTGHLVDPLTTRVTTGAATSWPHSFPAPDVVATSPTTIGSIGTYWNPNLSGALVGTGLAMTLDDAGPNDLDLDQSGGSVAISTTTVNGKTALVFDATTKSMRHLSQPAGQGTNKLDITAWGVIKILNGPPSFSSMLLGLASGDSTNRTLRTPPPPAGTFIQIPHPAFTVGDVIVFGITKPTSGASKLWVGDNVQTGTLTNAADVHLFVGGGAQQFVLCAAGTFDKILTDSEFAGLHAWAKDASLGWQAL